MTIDTVKLYILVLLPPTVPTLTAGLIIREGVFDMILLAVFLLVVVPTTEEVPTQIQRHSAMNL